MTLTLEQFQKDAQPWLAALKETGESLVLLAGGETYEVRRTVPAKEQPIQRDLEAIPKSSSIVGDPEDIVHIDWSSEWRP